MSDGTFGTLAELGPLAPETVDAIENHRFSPVRSVWWRNSDLDFRTLRALRNSLEVRPPLPVLRRVPEAEDHLALRHLAADAEIARLAGDPDGVRLLWEVCQIPDFRKTMIEAHNRLLGGIYRHLRQRDGRLPEDWVANQLSRLDRTDGDIDTLMARIAHVRTWTYIAHRADWLDDSAHWQDRARDVEDRLSDALHESLSQRFIDRRGAALARSRGKDRIEAELDSDGGVFVEGERVGRLDGLRFIADETASGTTRRLLAATATRALQGEVGRRVAEIVAAPDAEFDLADDGGILWRGARVGALAKGADILSPAVRIASTDLLAPAHRQRGEERLARWIAALLSGPFGTLCAFEGAGLSPPARGIAFQLREGLGTLSRRHARGQIAALDATDRKDLRALGVRIGVDAIFIPALVKPRAVRLRAILWVLWHDLAPIAPPAAGLVTVAADPEIPDGFYEAVGFSMHAGRAVRTDIADRLSVRLKRLARAGRFELPADLAPLLGLGNDETEAIVCAMGYRRVPDGTEFEPHPASRRHETRAARPRSRRGARGRQKPGDSPFAALAGLRRR
jgi:ATP-dependent RNA helicase SUPV3L1/SUV3